MDTSHVFATWEGDFANGHFIFKQNGVWFLVGWHWSELLRKVFTWTKVIEQPITAHNVILNMARKQNFQVIPRA